LLENRRILVHRFDESINEPIDLLTVNPSLLALNISIVDEKKSRRRLKEFERLC
jgi:hypothetical protein